MHKYILLVTISFAPLLSFASTMVGNPNSGVVLMDGPNVYVHGVVAHRCTSGTQVLPVATVLAKGDSQALEFDEDEFCSMDLYVKWTPGGATQTIAVGGFDVFKAAAGGATVAIEIDATTQSATLN